MTKNGVRHFSTNLLLVPTEEGGRAAAYMIALERETSGGPVEITLFGSMRTDSSRLRLGGDSRNGSGKATVTTTPMTS